MHTYIYESVFICLSEASCCNKTLMLHNRRLLLAHIKFRWSPRVSPPSRISETRSFCAWLHFFNTRLQGICAGLHQDSRREVSMEDPCLWGKFLWRGGKFHWLELKNVVTNNWRKGWKYSSSTCLGRRENAYLKATTVHVTAYYRAYYLFHWSALMPAWHWLI